MIRGKIHPKIRARAVLLNNPSQVSRITTGTEPCILLHRTHPREQQTHAAYDVR
jgi:hypothetical protein